MTTNTHGLDDAQVAGAFISGPEVWRQGQDAAWSSRRGAA
jgi:hypothetical protein